MTARLCVLSESAGNSTLLTQELSKLGYVPPSDLHYMGRSLSSRGADAPPTDASERWVVAKYYWMPGGGPNNSKKRGRAQDASPPGTGKQQQINSFFTPVHQCTATEEVGKLSEPCKSALVHNTDSWSGTGSGPLRRLFSEPTEPTATGELPPPVYAVQVCS